MDKSHQASAASTAVTATGSFPRIANGLLEPRPFALLVALLYAVVAGVAVANHVMWRDEWLGWLTASENHSFADLMRGVHGGGRPAGWYVCAWLVSKLGHSPEIPKIFHVSVSTLQVYLVARVSALTHVQKVLFAFGYFILYEWGTLLRDYNFESLLIFVAFSLLLLRPQRIITLGLVLALLAQTMCFGMALSVVFAGIWIARRMAQRRSFSVPEVSRIACSTALVALSLTVAYFQARPTQPLWVYGLRSCEDPYGLRIIRAVGYLWNACCPIPSSTWNSNIIDGLPLNRPFLGALCFATCVAVLWRSRWALLTYLAGTLALLASFVVFDLWDPGGNDWYASVRYHGHLFVVMLLALWWRRIDGKGGIDRWMARQFLTVVLLIHCIAAAIALNKERNYPFSGAKAAAEIIQSRLPADTPVLGDPDYASSAVAGYLHRPIYIASRREEATFMKLDTLRTPGPLSADELVARVREYLSQQKRDIVVVASYPLGGILPPDSTFLGATPPSLVDERFMVVLVHYHPRSE